MSSFSSLSSICAQPSTPCSYRHRSGGKQAQACGSRTPTRSVGRTRRLRPGSSGETSASVCSRTSLPSSVGSPGIAHGRPGNDWRMEEEGGAGDELHPSDPESRSVTKVRATAGARNEAAQVLRASGKLKGLLPRATAAHQFRHASKACHSLQPDNTVTSPPSYHSATSSPASPLRNHPLREFGRIRQNVYFTHPDSVASFAHPRPSTAFFGPSTPSPSPRVQRSRSQRSSPYTPPRSVLLRRGFVPERGPPTLAMSMQIHAPSPLPSSHIPFSLPATNRARSCSRPRISRPTSPQVVTAQLPVQRPPMPRPPSRSEKLLRDTLRRAEEHERMMSPPLPTSSPRMHSTGLPASDSRIHQASPAGRRHRRSTSSSLDSGDCDAPHVNERNEDEDAQNWLWRTASGGSSSSGQHAPHYHQHQNEHGPGTARPGLARNRSVTGSDGPMKTQTQAQASPKPKRMQLQRSLTSASHLSRQSQTRHPRPPRASLDTERPQPCACPGHGSLTPHEAVLRSRLEGVLRGAKEQERRTRSAERRESVSGSTTGSGSGNSMASSRNLSGEGDFFFGAGGDACLSPLDSVEYKSPASKVRTSLSSPRSPRPVLQPSFSPSSPSGSPRTPPDSPPFDAHTAAALCRAMDGYVSFANIEGLGVPDGEDEDEESVKERGRWWGWLTIPKRRERSGSASSFASR